MDKRDAELFTKFVQFSWFMNDVLPLVMETEDDVYKKQGIDFRALKHLDNIGLISFEPMGGYKKPGFGKHTVIYYFGRQVILEFPKETGNNFQIGKVMLSQAGQELAVICGAKRNEEFFDYIIEKWQKAGIKVTAT